MPISVSLVRKLEEVEPQLRGVLLTILDELERQREETVTKREFGELKSVVAELAEAQKRTEKELHELRDVVAELAEAQKRTEKELRELAEAQKRTEKALQDLMQEHSKTREQVGGLSMTVGYVLENEAYKFLPALLKQEFGFEVKGRLVRDFVKDNRGKQIEVNVIGEATKNGENFVIIGESKVQLSKNKVLEFLTKKLKRLEGVYAGELFPILITHMKSEPDVEEFALKQGIKRIFYSYEFGYT
jgi:hypothetical protein